MFLLGGISSNLFASSLFFLFFLFGASNEKVEEWQYAQECISYLILGTCFILCNLYILKMLIILVILAWLRSFFQGRKKSQIFLNIFHLIILSPKGLLHSLGKIKAKN